MNARPRLPATVWALGLVSLLTDLASEMIVPLLPLFLAGLGGTMLGLGFLQGTSDLVVAALKLLSGVWSDRQRSRKRWVVGGYLLSALVRPLFAVVLAPWQAVLVRAGDRVGKGLRSAPRDALLADAVEPARRGEAYGVQRAMDHAGACGGALLGALLLWGGCELRTLFALALVPGLAAVLVLVAAVREPDRQAAAAAPHDPAGALRRLWPFLLVVAFASVGTSVDLFLLARAMELGYGAVGLLLLWALLHVVRAAFASPCGALSDRLGRRRVLVLGLVNHLGVMALFAATQGPAWVAPLFALHGLHAAFSEGAERGYVADLTGAHQRGTAFGVYHAVQGLAALVGPLVLGGLWDAHGAGAAFACAAAATGLALGLLLALVRPGGGAAAGKG